MVFLKIEINTEYLINAAITFAAIAAFILAFIIIYLFIFLRRRDKYLHLKYLYSNFLSEVILSDDRTELDAVMQKNYVRRILTYWMEIDYAKRLLLRTMVKAKKSITGSAADNIVQIYQNTGLVNSSIAALRSSNWHVKARAVQQLSEMNQQDQIPKIYRLTNSKNHYVRKEAQTAIVKLTGVEGLRFLNMLNQPISEWHQICLLEQLPDFAEIPVERYHSWLSSPNNSVVTFAMSLAGKYQVYQLNEKISAFIVHETVAVRKQAYLTLLELNQPETPDLVIKHYENADHTTKLMILEIIRRIGSAGQLPFMRKLSSNNNPEIELRAREVISQFENNGQL